MSHGNQSLLFNWPKAAMGGGGGFRKFSPGSSHRKAGFRIGHADEREGWHGKAAAVGSAWRAASCAEVELRDGNCVKMIRGEMSNADVGVCMKPLLSNLQNSIGGLLLWKEDFCCDHSYPDRGVGQPSCTSTHSTNSTVVQAVRFLQGRKWGVLGVLCLNYVTNYQHLVSQKNPTTVHHHASHHCFCRRPHRSWHSAVKWGLLGRVWPVSP